MKYIITSQTFDWNHKVIISQEEYTTTFRQHAMDRYLKYVRDEHEPKIINLAIFDDNGNFSKREIEIFLSDIVNSLID